MESEQAHFPLPSSRDPEPVIIILSFGIGEKQRKKRFQTLTFTPSLTDEIARLADDAGRRRQSTLFVLLVCYIQYDRDLPNDELLSPWPVTPKFNCEVSTSFDTITVRLRTRVQTDGSCISSSSSPFAVHRSPCSCFFLFILVSSYPLP